MPSLGSSAFAGRSFAPRRSEASSVRFQSTEPAQAAAVDAPEASDYLGSLDSSQIKSELFKDDEVITEVVRAVSEADLSSSWHALARLIIHVHESTDLPWWSVIVGTSLSIKMIILPLMAKSAGISAHIQQEEKAVSSIRENFLKNNPERSMVQTQQMQKEISSYYHSKGIKPSHMLYCSLATLPVQIYPFFQLRVVCRSDMESLRDGGLLWFSDLTQSDPLFLLPVLVTAFSMMNVSMPHLVTNRFGLVPKPVSLLISKIMGVVFIPIGFFIALLPAGMQLLVCFNIFTTLLMSFAYRSSLFRRLFNLPVNTGVQFSLEHSDPKRIQAAFGDIFTNVAPPPLKAKGESEKESVTKKAFNLITKKNKKNTPKPSNKKR